MYQPPQIIPNLPYIAFPVVPQTTQTVPYTDLYQLPYILQKAETEKIRTELNKIYITKEEVTLLLTQDSYYRKLKSWPLITIDEMFLMELKRNVDSMFGAGGTYYYGQDSTKIVDIHKVFDEYFPCINKLLLEFDGHLVACGGAIIKSLFRTRGRGDIDLFFYDLTPEEADKMRLDAVAFLVNSFNNDIGDIDYYIKRNEYTTTLCITISFDGTINIYEYQFIHRIYPDISSIIGGFDLSICMIAYDGKEIYATPLGAWSIQNRSVIIDTKRRSTSFEHRLQKYQMKGFVLIFPGISQKLVQEFSEKNSAKAQMINKMKIVARQYGYEYFDDSDDFKFVGDAEPECTNYNVQKKENILPYFKLGEYSGLHTPTYNRKEIEDRLTNKISDYSSLSSHPKCFPSINAQQLRSDNLHSVSSILKLDIRKDINTQLINDTNNPNLMIDDAISKFYNRVEKIRVPLIHRRSDIENKNLDFHRLVKCFGKLTPKVIEIRGTDEYYEYRDMIIDKMVVNTETCRQNLIGVKWINQDPQRQWTASINPIIADPREWYGKHYEPVITGIPSEIETLMRLMRLPKTESVWTMIDDDVFNVICLHLLGQYANDAWNYIK